MRSPTSCEGASLVMFGIRLETLPMEASTSVSPNAFVASAAGLVSGLSAASAVATIPSVAGLESVPDLAAGGGPDSLEHPASATTATTTAIRDSGISMALTYFGAGAEGGAGAGFGAGCGGVAAGAGARTAPRRGRAHRRGLAHDRGWRARRPAAPG